MLNDSEGTGKDTIQAESYNSKKVCSGLSLCRADEVETTDVR